MFTYKRKKTNFALLKTPAEIGLFPDSCAQAIEARMLRKVIMESMHTGTTVIRQEMEERSSQHLKNGLDCSVCKLRKLTALQK